MMVERRKYARYLPQTNAFAALGRKYTRIGRIQNIALNGLAFKYIVGDAQKKGATVADIILAGNVFHLHNIPCRIIYDFEMHMPHVNNDYAKILTTKICGLRFRRLSRDDAMQLNVFIENCTAKLL